MLSFIQKIAAGRSNLDNLGHLFSIIKRDCYKLRSNDNMLLLPIPNTNAMKKTLVMELLFRGGSTMRGPPGTLVFASHLHPHPEARVCATNIFIGSDIVDATILRFLNGFCHHYTSSTCVTFCLSSKI